ncbi:hypothetical protein RGQ29_003466 [Quercus rubra]|uniref:Uncharacterized protein n=1 Tax=Quercus rubra TaxID=3512 RepID=A0AAN7ECA5_QUERU|nr:hypothetical protein RGQ29_003466 [Quercus rubra]
MSLIDGTILCRILNMLRIGSVNEVGDYNQSTVLRAQKIKRFLAAMGNLGIPSFKESDLEKGSMKTVIDCLLTLRAQYKPTITTKSKSGSPRGNGSPRGQFSESKLQRTMRSPIMSEPFAATVHSVGQKFHEVFQVKPGRYADLPAAKISEMMKSNSLDNAPTQSLLSVVNGILDESVERKNGEIPYRVACLLRKVVQEIERRISTQAEHLRTQNNLFKTREEKYQSRIRVLETLASGTSEESQIVMNQLQHIKTERTKMEEKKKFEEEDLVKLTKENENNNLEISTLKQELEVAKKAYELHCSQMDTQAKDAKTTLEERLKELEHLLEDSKNKMKKLESYSESKHQRWNQKEQIYLSNMEFQFGALQELRFAFTSIKQEIMKAQKSYSEEFSHLGVKLKVLAEASENYNSVLAENRKMFNEIQELKGNIRVFCRIRPFLPGQKEKQTIVDYIGEDGELVIANPSKPGKDSHRLFKFNKVFGLAATQEEVFSDIQPLIRSVLDGFNVCIFAYGQTGSGKTFTMTGPNGATKENWGVNYRALNDLFDISQSRRSALAYEMGVQMIEIYNEQCTGAAPIVTYVYFWTRVTIATCPMHWSTGPVPDASMQPVNSTSDVIEIMDTGLRNRAVGATALNERSSRSHSVVTINVRGKDLKTGAALLGNLHLVDLAGSERVDRSEVTGDRLREAQHINKSLSALGDVIFALAQKSPHVPYRNSKLTQVLQSSLGGQAKTLMFVQLNPDGNSYSESLSTLKFAERVSGVELGAARSNKEGRDVRELMEQVASLKSTIAKKDEEIEQLQLRKGLKSVHPDSNGEKRGTAMRYASSSPRRETVGGTTPRSQKPLDGKGLAVKSASDPDFYSEQSDKNSEDDFQNSMDDFKYQNELVKQSKVAGDTEIIGLGDADYDERSSDISDGGLSMGTDTDGSVESTFTPESTKRSDIPEKPKLQKLPPKVSRAPLKPGRTGSPTTSKSKPSPKLSPKLITFPTNAPFRF